MRKYLTIRKTSVHIGLVICLLAILVGSMVYASGLWSKTVSSSVTITGSVSANLYSDLACSTVLTSVSFPSIDRLNLNYTPSAIFYLKYEGSDDLTNIPLLIKSNLGEIGLLSAQWKVNNGIWHDMASQESIPSLKYGNILNLQVQIKQTASNPKATYSFSFTVQIGVA
jgi:hypothetical protein